MILWTVLTIALAALLLIALSIALSRTLHHLTGTRNSLEKIAMGVRAIERETAPIGPTLTSIGSGVTAVTDELRSGADSLGAAADSLPDAARTAGLI